MAKTLTIPKSKAQTQMAPHAPESMRFVSAAETKDPSGRISSAISRSNLSESSLEIKWW